MEVESVLFISITMNKQNDRDTIIGTLQLFSIIMGTGLKSLWVVYILGTELPKCINLVR